ncbi:MAG: prolyl oligopeptidase family serine peptidase [Actinomycetota bacterium]|nr:prolyl oligopeptidase family serine peptidase [Actinomycetota bacterium]
MTSTSAETSFPRLSARTQRFTLGAPRSITASPDGSRVLFLRSRGGTDRNTCLWALDVTGTPAERLLADPLPLLGSGEEDLPPEERARRERLREGAGGIVGYATDRDVTCAVFALSSRLWVTDVAGGTTRELPTAGPVIDPRPDPAGRQVAYVSGGALHVVGMDGSGARTLAEPDGPGVTWGLAEFVAAEEMGRLRGYWWSPDGSSLLAARSDDSPVPRWHIADPANPQTPATEVAYPAAGADNAVVTLSLLDLDGGRWDVPWDRDAFPYLVTVSWSAHGEPLLLVQSRDQRRTQVLGVDVASGTTSIVREDVDEHWLHITAGVPAWGPGRRLVHVRDTEDTRRVYVNDSPVTPVGVQVRSVLDVTDEGVLVSASAEATEAHVWWVPWDGPALFITSEPGMHTGRSGGGLTVLASSALDRPGTRVSIQRSGKHVADVTSHAEVPPVHPRVELLRTGARNLRTALVLPRSFDPAGGQRLPVLMDPYGGPGGQRVVCAHNAYLTSQWFADQGFAVVVTDGRGTPGRGPAWEHEIAFDVAGPVLEDQVDALTSLAADRPWLDLDRVAIRGWSFGGYLAALAVLRRPDVFAAAVAGAPVTDWSLYDTHYTERYLGLPQSHPEAYERSSILADAERLQRPLLLIHGLADDNVVAAHTLKLSSALLAAARPHTVLPLSGVTHMTPQELVAEGLLLLEVEFLRVALADPAQVVRT